MTTDTAMMLDTAKDANEQRLCRYEINPRIFGWLMERKVRLSGLPPDAEYVRSWYDPACDTLSVIYRSQWFDFCPLGVMPYRGVLTVTEYHDPA